MSICIRRREFIAALGGAAAAWPLAARAQQRAMPVIGLVSPRSPEDSARLGAGFRKALSEAGYIEGQNVTVEYHWVEGQYDRLPALMADLVRRRAAERSDEFSPSKANAHLALPCEGTLSRQNSTAQARGPYLVR